MLSVALLLLLAAGSSVKCEQLTQPASATVQPGQRLTISCQVSYSLGSYATHWIRQPAGKGLEWIGYTCQGCTPIYKDSLRNKFSLTLDSPSKTVTLNGQNLQPQDSAVYYCARGEWGGLGNAFDYWGKGTEVTVSTETNASPSLFPLTACGPGSGDTIILGCLAQDFFPKSATFQWTSTTNTQVNSQQFIFPQQNVNNKFTGVSVISVPSSSASSYTCSLTHPAGNKDVSVKYAFSPPNVTLLSESDGEKQVLVCSIENFTPKKVSISWKKNNNNVNVNVKRFEPMKDGAVYSAASILKVDKTEWDSKAVYTCDVTHAGKNYTKKASKASFTVTLNPPNPKAMFVNKQAELKCVITGLDGGIVRNAKIQWYIDEQPVTNNISESNDAQTKTSTLIRYFDDWKKVKTVKCSATREGMASITESLNVNRGKEMPTVEVLKLSEDTKEVTLVCLVTSKVLQDYYIAWSEASGHDNGIYNDGLNLPPQKISSVYQVSSFYTITKDKWINKNKFSCIVWPAGSEEKMKPHDVSSFSGNSCECDE